MQFTHGNFNLFTAISIYSRQFQFVHGNFNLLAAISICSRQFQFTRGNFSLFTAISILLTAVAIYSRQLQFTHGNFNFSSNKPQVHCRLYPIRQHERLSIKLRKLQQAKSSRKNTARNVNLAQPSTSAHSAPRINNVQNSDVHRLAETLRAKINELDEVLNVIKTAPENKRFESYPRLLSESLEIRGKGKDNSKSKKRFSTEREKNAIKTEGKCVTKTHGSCSLRVMGS